MLHQRFAGQHFDAHAFDARSGAGEITVHEFPVQADRFENLRALVALQRGNAHLRKSLQQALVGGLHVALENLVPGVVGREMAVAVEIFERSDREIRIHRARAVAEQQREVHHLARLARFHDQRHLVARLLADQMIVNRRERQQARNRRVFVVHAAIGKDQQRVARLDGLRGALAKIFDGLLQRALAAFDAEQRRQRGGQEISPFHAAQLFEAPVRNDRMAQLQRVAVFRRLFEDVSLAPDVAVERHHQVFADRIDRRIGHLREGLLEIVEQQLRLVRKARERRVDAHRSDRLFALDGRRDAGSS